MYFQKILVISMVVAVLTACGGEKSAKLNSETKPSNASPTSTPTPSSKSIATTSPTAKPETNTNSTKTDNLKSLIKSSNPKADITSGAQFQVVKATDFTTYQAANNLFSLEIPKAWNLQNNSKAGEIVNLWFDPSKNALIAVNIFQAPEKLTPDKLPELLRRILKQTFGSRPDFAMEEPVKQADGSVQIVWGYSESVKAGNDTATGWVQGNSFIEQKGNKVSLITAGVLSKQFNDLKEPITRIVNSYKLNADAAIK